MGTSWVKWKDLETVFLRWLKWDWNVSTRKSVDIFNWKVDCLFCGKPWITDNKYPKTRLVFSVTFVYYREIILKYCSNLCNYKWSENVKWRVVSCNDLIHEEARCRKLFTRSKITEASSPRLAGRPRKLSKRISLDCANGWKVKEIHFLWLSYIKKWRIWLNLTSFIN